MTTVNVALNSMDRVRGFNTIISESEYECDLVLGRYVIDAKSVMGIFSLDLSKPLQLVIHNRDEDDISALLGSIEQYLV